ncbi:PREDICTED: ribosomal protein S6 kinase-like 1 [Rhagoletis zephyria]|uniref:ribosomal protein S6 kinase-like 1 n=1 Tax=Rhagoletis zephyria TaxID=28612 RepID=UPI000811450A|nr:PREDICTED: ribosomal protein S6 kinase-like 1 [Rhagoletis zephyria]
MTPYLGGWIHNFTVTDTQTHKGGYTIYKITSIVFPRSLPQALTCLTTWKRFHDIKRLHRELSRRHRTLKLPGQLPEPTDCSFFKRFDADIILRRKEYILQLLDFAAQHPALYKCHAFTQFFSDAQHTGVGNTASRGLNTLTPTPNASPLHPLHKANNLKGVAIVEICDKLDLRYDQHEIDTSITLLDPLQKTPQKIGNFKTVNTITENKSDDSAKTTSPINKPADEPILRTEIIPEQTVCKDYKRFLTPMASIESDDSDYIYEAALEFSKAVQAEANLDYQEAHVRYKRGVELLLIGSKDDSNDERKFIAKAKILKYLARADDIYEKFLNGDSNDRGFGGKNNFQLSIDVTDCSIDGKPTVYLERPWNHLAKYKVLKVLGDRVMQVYCVTEPEPRTTYVMKGIEKPSSNMPTQTVFLPQHVPYMVDLLSLFQSEQKIFLLLKHAEGGSLYEYIQTYTPTVVSRANNYFSVLFPDETQAENNLQQIEADISSSASILSVHDSRFADENKSSRKANSDDSTKLATSESLEFSEIVRTSQQLLQSVSKTLHQIKQLEDPPNAVIEKGESQFKESTSETASSLPNSKDKTKPTKIPEASLKQWARELAVAINSLHGKGVILSDLHMENLLLGAKGQLLLSYFYQNEGLTDADNYIHKAYSPTALAGHYVAPERPLTFKSDWWSYGIILYQLIIGLPFKSAHPGCISLYGCVQYPDNIEISECARDLLEKLLQQSPEERADFEQIQAHNFFVGTNWKAVTDAGFSCNSNERNRCKDSRIS